MKRVSGLDSNWILNSRGSPGAPANRSNSNSDSDSEEPGTNSEPDSELDSELEPELEPDLEAGLELEAAEPAGGARMASSSESPLVGDLPESFDLGFLGLVRKPIPVGQSKISQTLAASMRDPELGDVLGGVFGGVTGVLGGVPGVLGGVPGRLTGGVPGLRRSIPTHAELSNIVSSHDVKALSLDLVNM